MCFVNKMLICLICIGSLAFPNFAYAADAANIVIEQKTAEPGEVVEIQINLAANPGLAHLRIDVYFDSTRLAIDGADAIIRGAALNRLSIINTTTDFAELETFPITWWAIANDRSTGTILTVRFQVLDDAPAGLAEITARVGERNAFVIYGQESVPVAVLVSPGGVIIPGGDVPPDAPQNTTPPGGNAGEASVDDFFIPPHIAPQLNPRQELNLPAIEPPDFADISADGWYYDAVAFVAARGLFEGVGDNLFAPQANMTRAMFITVLARLDGINLQPFDYSPFWDVAINRWYGPAIAWALMAGIIGQDAANPGAFRPDDNITREDMAVFIANYLANNDFPLAAADVSQFYDILDAAPHARPAILAMRRYSIIHGMGDNTYYPRGLATRAQVATIFRNLVNAVVGLD